MLEDESHAQLTAEEQNRHMLITGATGSGKTRALISMICQHIINGTGCSIIDPHGDITRYLKSWYASRSNRLHRTIHFVDVADASHAFAFDPIAVDDPSQIPTMASGFANSMSAVFSNGDPRTTPLITSNFYTIAYALADLGLGLPEAVYFLFQQEDQVRRSLIDQIGDDYVRRFWENQHAARPHEYMVSMESVERRVRAFLIDPLARRIFGQKQNSIDFHGVINRGETVVLNLGNIGGRQPSLETARIIGTLYLSTLISKARERDPDANNKLHHLIIDECQNFITADYATTLDQLRKFGICLNLSCQFPDQIRYVDERVFQSVTKNTNTKINFSMNDYEDAKLASWTLFADQINPDRVKEVLTRPAVVGHTIRRMKSESTSNTVQQGETEGQAVASADGEAASTTRNWGTGSATADSHTSGSVTSEMSAAGFSHVESTGLMDDMATTGFATVHTNEGFGEARANSSSSSSSHSEFEGYGRASTRSFSQSEAHSKGRSTQRGTAEQEGYSETLAPVMRTLPTATYSLDEQAHTFANGLMQLPKRFAYLKRAGQKAVLIKSLDTPDPIVSDEKTNRVISEMKSACPYLTTAAEADAEIELRRRQVEDLAFGVSRTPTREPEFFD